ncbi:MAG TPA: energy transducer TonB [Planctomycetota bacterium]|nr:energy transducer TonB [Planctomycetota bacterium]
MRWGWLGSGVLHGTVAGAAFLAALASVDAPRVGIQAPPPVPMRLDTAREAVEAPRFEAEATPVPPVPEPLLTFEPDRPEPDLELQAPPVKHRSEPILDRPLVTLDRLAPPPAPIVESEIAPVEQVNPPPAYPALARRRGLEGHALVEVRVLVDGTCAEPRLLEWSGSRLFGDAALEAVRTWRYTPASIGGRPVERPHTIRFTFRLR